ncbi:MAG: hypothetical protein OEM38_00545 [Gammaproteobacteria bacterium]|nr:hypothetical protein [Gammaproteobacteria bacterium]
MAFKEYNFLEIEYNDNDDTCKVTVEITDDVIGTVGKTFILESSEFKGKGFNANARNAKIKQLVKQRVKSIHEMMVDGATKRKAPKAKTKIPPFAKVTTLN